MTPKQDKTYTRTASELERKYGFGKTFAEILGIAEDAQDAALEAQKNVTELDENLTQDEIFNRLTKNGEVKGIYRDDEGNIYINADYIKTGTILADLIKAGVIRSKDGSSVVIDLDKGEGTFTGTLRTTTSKDATYSYHTLVSPGGVDVVANDNITGWGASDATLRSASLLLHGTGGETRLLAPTADAISSMANLHIMHNNVGAVDMGVLQANPDTGEDAYAFLGLNNFTDGTMLAVLLQSGRVKISGLTAPVDSSDAVNKAYVDKRAENVFYQTDANGNISLSGISAYPTKSGVYRVISVVAGLPDDVNGYGSLVIFNGGSYMLHLYQDANGLLYYARTADGVTVPTSWKVCGGKRCIWTNPSPSADFARQNVNRDLSEYNFVNIKFAFHKTFTDSLYCWWERCPIGEMGAATFTSIGGTSYPVTVRRTFYATQNGIQFSTGAYHQGTTFNESDPSRAIPLEIYVE